MLSSSQVVDPRVDDSSVFHMRAWVRRRGHSAFGKRESQKGTTEETFSTEEIATGERQSRCTTRRCRYMPRLVRAPRQPGTAKCTGATSPVVPCHASSRESSNNHHFAISRELRSWPQRGVSTYACFVLFCTVPFVWSK